MVIKKVAYLDFEFSLAELLISASHPTTQTSCTGRFNHVCDVEGAYPLGAKAHYMEKREPTTLTQNLAVA